MNLDAARRVARGIRTSVSHNSGVYGYSVMITTAMAGVQTGAGPPSIPRLFLFAVGAAGAFTALEALGTDFFRDRVKEDPPEVIMLGSAIGVISISAGLATAISVSHVFRSWIGWMAASFGATAVYLLVVGIELALARRAEEAAGNE